MLYLHALGHFHPETVLDNHFLSSLDIGVDVKWIEDRVGIVERRTTLPLDYLRETRNRNPRAAAEAAHTTPSQMSAGATRMALQRAGIEASQLGMIVSGGCSPEMQIPADASRIASSAWHLRDLLRSAVGVLNLRIADSLSEPDAARGTARLRARGQQRNLYPHHRLQRPPPGRTLWRCGCRRDCLLACARALRDLGNQLWQRPLRTAPDHHSHRRTFRPGGPCGAGLRHPHHDRRG